MSLPYAGRAAALATRHGKERALGSPFRQGVGLILTVPEDLDTDALGTFSGEIERVSTPQQVAIQKARLGISATGLPCVRPQDPLDDFLQRVGFPSHALIVRPHGGWDRQVIFKGLTGPQALSQAILVCASAASDGRALVQTDMRAHLNPTRMQCLRQLGWRLAVGWLSPAPPVGRRGCRTPTELVRSRIWGCALCATRSSLPRPDGRQSDP